MPPRPNQNYMMSQSDINNQRQGDISVPLSEQFSEDDQPFKSLDQKSEPDISSHGARGPSLEPILGRA